MSLYYDRASRAFSEVPGGYDFLGRKTMRARSVLPESLYERAYERSENSILSREMSKVRELSSVRSEIYHSKMDDILPNPIVERAMSKVRELEDKPSCPSVIQYMDSFKTSDALVHAKITIRKRDNYWQKKYEEDILNVKPNVYVVRPRYIVQRPIIYTPPPTPPVHVPVPVPYRVIRTPRVYETVRTYRRFTRYHRPSYLYTHGTWTTYPTYF